MLLVTSKRPSTLTIMLERHIYSQSTGFGLERVLVPRLLAGLSKTCWRRAQARARTPPLHLPRDAQHRPQHPYSTGDSNQLDNVNINVKINVNAPDGVGPSPEQPSAQPPPHARLRPDMPAHYRSRLKIPISGPLISAQSRPKTRLFHQPLQLPPKAQRI